jgi:hypothetical protein
MEASGDFHDLFSGGATPVFDSSDPLDSFWAEVDTNDLHQPTTWDNRASVEPQALQQHTTEEGEDETEGKAEEEEAGGHDGQPRLPMLHEWDSTTEPSLDTLRYTVEWKAVLNTKRIGMNTEENIFLTPGAFWDAALHSKIDEALSREFAPQDRPEPCNTVVVVSVNKRAERDITKEFLGLDVDWSIIGEKLESWACYFGKGKRLLVKVTFRFRPRNTPPRTRAASGGRPSATRRMRYGQALQRDAEVHANGQAAYWRAVYNTLRCPGRPCQNSQGWCWRDPHGGKHYKLLTVHLRQLVEHAKEGNKLNGHHDIPDHIRQQLYAEADQRVERRQNLGTPASAMLQMQAGTPTAILTPGAMQSSPEHRQSGSLNVAIAPALLESLDIPGPHEDAIRDHVTWQRGQATTNDWISQFAKAGDILLKQGFRLNLFYQRQLVSLLTDEGVLHGIALSFHSDIPKWLSEYRSTSDGSPVYTSETPGGSY